MYGLLVRAYLNACNVPGDKMEFLKITIFSVLAAICYGILHDQITAHLCVEYFTIAHPPVFPTQSPFLLAIGWGIVATWWVGFPLGILAASAARIGRRNRLSFAQVYPMILRLLVVMAICATLAGGLGAYLVATGRQALLGGWDQLIPREKWIAFSADQWAHLASYGSGIIGGLFLVGYIVWHRVAGQRKG
jgi:hypothetical protein